MSPATHLKVPTPQSQAALYRRYFKEESVTAQSVLEAVGLTYQRADVFLRDALDVYKERGLFQSACKAGCGYCCHTLVSALPPEAFHVARALEEHFDPTERDELKSEIRRRDTSHRGRTGAERYAERAACPFLHPQTWNCRLHAFRPSVCRAMHSGSLPACIAAYDARDPNKPAPTMKAFFDNRDAAYIGLTSALDDYGLVMRPAELNAALVVIWDGEAVFERWLSGEDVFSSARIPAEILIPESRSQSSS